jgi:hypothetical protein
VRTHSPVCVLYSDTDRGAKETAGAGLTKATTAAAAPAPKTRRRVSTEAARNG